jgi:hypothetical protein
VALALEVNFWVMNVGVEDLKYQWLIFDLNFCGQKNIFLKKAK